MKLGDYSDYKDAIRARVKEMQTIRPGLTLKRVAEKIPIQYTYLSKVLNDSNSHLSEDHVFEVARILEMFPQEADYLLLLRAHQTTAHPARKQSLFKRIEKERGSLGVSAAIREGAPAATDFAHEMNYLLDPFASVVRLALHLSQFREDPKKLCALLGVSLARLKSVLMNLKAAGFIETGTTPFQILKINKEPLHFSREHPLMRIHQYLMNIACQNQLMKMDEEEKENFLVTFSAGESTRKAIQKEFKDFLKRVEDLASKSKDESVYQMNFQLFRWV